MLDIDGLRQAATIDAYWRLRHGFPGESLLYCEANPHGFNEPVYVCMREDGLLAISEVMVVRPEDA